MQAFYCVSTLKTFSVTYAGADHSFRLNVFLNKLNDRVDMVTIIAYIYYIVIFDSYIMVEY